MSESVGTAQSAEPNLGELTSMLEAKRVYDELGGLEECQALIDHSPKLLYENEVTLRLRQPTATPRDYKVYIFEDQMIIAYAAQNKTSTEAKREKKLSDLVWFGNEKSDKESIHEDMENHDREEVLHEISMEREALKKFNLKMWIELAKCQARLLRGENKFGIAIVFVSKIEESIAPGEYRYDTVVDGFDIWMEKESDARTILKQVQDVIARKGIAALARLRSELQRESEKKNSFLTDNFDTDTDDESCRRKSSGKFSARSVKMLTLKSRSRSMATLKKNKRLFKLLINHQNLAKEAKHGVAHIERIFQDLQAQFLVQDGGEDEDSFLNSANKSAEITVHFRGGKLGFGLSDGKGKYEPYIATLHDYGVAKSAGVIIGDKIVAINDLEISKEHTTEQVRDIIDSERKMNPRAELVFVFRRKEKAEKDRIMKQIQQYETFEQVRAEEAEESDDGAVKPVEEAASTDGESFRKHSTELMRKAKTSQNTILNNKTTTGRRGKKKTKGKGKGTRTFHAKRKFYKERQQLASGDIDNYGKNRKKLYERYENNAMLFSSVLGSSKSTEEKNCVHALEEIYQTENRYNGSLNFLKKFHKDLSSAKKQVLCKHLKSGGIFCEHMRRRRTCSRESFVREEAIEKEKLNAMFINLSSIIKTNQFLWNNLENQLAKLYKKSKNEKVEIYEMLEVFCNVFVEIAPFLQIYWAYCNRLKVANELQRTLKAENPHFKSIVHSLEKKLKKKLHMLLAAPLQQSMRYHLLFETLKKHVGKYLAKQTDLPKDHVDLLTTSHKRITHAHQVLVGLGNKIETLVGKAAADEQFIEIFDEIGGKNKVPDLMEASRRFISKTQVMYEDEQKDLLEEQSFVYLFNDKIVVAALRPIPSGRTSKYGLNMTSATILVNKNSSKKRISMQTVATEKKLSLPKRGRNKQHSDKFKSRMSIRSTKSEIVRLSTTSKDSKDDFEYVILQNLNMDLIQEIDTCSKEVESIELKGVKFTSVESNNVMFDFYAWFDAKEQRDKFFNAATEAQNAYQLKVEEEKKVREKFRNAAKKNSAKPPGKESVFTEGSRI